PPSVGVQGLHIAGLAREHLGDRRQAEPEVSQQQLALQPHERVGVVVADAARAGGARPHEPDVVVVPQRATRDAGEARDLLDAVCHPLLLPAVRWLFCGALRGPALVPHPTLDVDAASTATPRPMSKMQEICWPDADNAGVRPATRPASPAFSTWAAAGRRGCADVTRDIS